jgi:three-Cys-motif partner protein
MAIENDFFDKSTDQSLVKSAIVSKYFEAWARVIMGSQDHNPHVLEKKIAYIDLFSGPGKYKDGTESTPLVVLKKTLQNDRMRERLVTIFNDKDATNIDSLEKEIRNLPGIEKLKFKPIFSTKEVGDDIVRLFEKTKVIPTLFFVDPWGYKGLSLKLVKSAVKTWGSDCIFFFNYRRINMGLNNPLFKEHMNALFGEERAAVLGEELKPLTVEERELLVIEELCQALKGMGLTFVLPFRFKDSNGRRTSHHLILVTRHPKGYEIMKDIMAKICSSTEQGVPSFEYNPVDANNAKQRLLFQLSRPLDDLAEMLLKEFAGQTITMREIYEQHNIDRPYIKKNYKNVLLNLEKEKKISASTHKKGTFGDKVYVTFPSYTGGNTNDGR